MRGVEALSSLYKVYENCDRCERLCRTRLQTVFGTGSARADLMIVGEAPGEDEDAEGVPFIGKAGRLLMNLLAYRESGVQVWPEDDDLENLLADPSLQGETADDDFFAALRDYFDNYVFWTNIVLCRPLNNEGKNDEPTTQEVKNCRDRLVRTIYAVDPMLIIGVGKHAATALLGKNVAITEQRGTLFDISIPSPVTGDPVRYPMLALLHPAHLLREGSLALVKKKMGSAYHTLKDLEYGINLLKRQYNDVFGTEFPHRPDDYKRD